MSSASLEDKNLYYAKRLAEMIKCKTISNKENIDETEFFKLRDVVKELFPKMHEKATLTILGDDAYLYKIKGKVEKRFSNFQVILYDINKV